MDWLEDAYRRYADQLYTYAWSLTRDREAAIDVVHDTFIVAAERISQLRDPSRLRPWLYAIARSVGLRHLRRQARQAPLEVAGEVKADTVDFTGRAHSASIADLVHSAMGGLSSKDAAIVELAVRHGLAAPDVAAILGLPLNHTHALLSRARSQMLASLGVVLVARNSSCADLATLLRGWDGTLNPLLRKRLHRHIEGCSACGSVREAHLDPAALLSAVASLPLLALPSVLFGHSAPPSLSPDALAPPTTPGAAPLSHTPSPADPAASPAGQAGSPAHAGASPVTHGASPAGQGSVGNGPLSPGQGHAGPAGSPADAGASPGMHGASPAGQDASPGLQNHGPFGNGAPAAGQNGSPAGQGSHAGAGGSPAAAGTSSGAKHASLGKQAGSPAGQSVSPGVQNYGAAENGTRPAGQGGQAGLGGSAEGQGASVAGRGGLRARRGAGEAGEGIRWGEDGFPVQAREKPRRRVLIAVAAGVIAAIGIAIGGVVATVHNGPDRSPSTVVSLDAVVVTESPTAAASSVVSSSPAKSTGTPALAFTAKGAATCIGGLDYKLTVKVTANANLGTATLYRPNAVPMTVTSKTATVTVTVFGGTSLPWHVQVVAADGRALTGPGQNTANPC